MSRELSHYSYEDVEELSTNFGRMGCEYGYSQESNQNGWVDNRDDLKEEDVWGGHDTSGHWNNLYSGTGGGAYGYADSEENGSTSKKKKGLKSWLSRELHAADVKGRKKGPQGLSFADLDNMENGGYGGCADTNGGWAPGFSLRKVKIPLVGGEEGDTSYPYGWHDPDLQGNRGGIPQSAPVSMPVWPTKCAYEESNGYVDVDDSSPVGDVNDDQDSGSCEDEDGSMDTERRRLAPHEIVDREYARSGPTSFSVIEGAGRTLKGSDLRRVRNAVWSCTGFED